MKIYAVKQNGAKVAGVYSSRKKASRKISKWCKFNLLFEYLEWLDIQNDLVELHLWYTSNDYYRFKNTLRIVELTLDD